jgi:hypothetical protein
MISSTNAAVQRHFDIKSAIPRHTTVPIVGGIYRDASGRSFVVLHIASRRALLEYADGSVLSIELANWPLLHPQSAIF